MSTARERARDAVLELAVRDGFGAAQHAEYEIQHMADAASDVWEPLVRKLLADIDTVRHQHNWLVHQDSYRRAQEALSAG